MARFPAGGLASSVLALAACNPTLNWREVQAPPSTLKAMLPCKPEKATRPVPMAGRTVALDVLGCEAGGATFAVLQADIGNPAQAGEVLWQWRIATLGNMRGSAASQVPFVPRHAVDIPQSARVAAQGRRADGSAVQSQAAYFAHGPHVFQAVIYADKVTPEMADPFFAGLELR